MLETKNKGTCSKEVGERKSGEQQRRSKKRGQGCSSLWCRSKSRWCPGRKVKEERKRKHTQRKCLCVYFAEERVRSAKRKGSDQRWDETTKEARGRQGRVGGTVKATRRLCTLQLFCFVYLCVSLWECFSFMISFPLFFGWQLHIHTYTLTVITFHSAWAGQRKHQGHKRYGNTLLKVCYTVHGIATKKSQLHVVDAILLSLVPGM